MTANDELLNQYMAAIKNGDKTKFHDLVLLSYEPLKNIAKMYLIDKSSAGAVLQDVYMKIHLYADRYDTSRDAGAYLWQIVKNKAFDYNDQFIKHNTVNIDDIPVFDKIDHYERANARMDVAGALKRVGRTNALIIMWTYRDELTQEEIASRLGITKSAVSQRLTKTKEKLSRYLK